MQSSRKPTGQSRINKAVQARLFDYIDSQIPRKFVHGIDSKIVSDAVELWLEVTIFYSLPEMAHRFDGLTPGEVAKLMIEQYDKK